MNKPLTAAENHMRNHWSMFGSNSIVEKLGSKWVIVQFGDMPRHPICFKTKHESVEAGTAMVIAMSRRAQGI